MAFLVEEYIIEYMAAQTTRIGRLDEQRVVKIV